MPFFSGLNLNQDKARQRRTGGLKLIHYILPANRVMLKKGRLKPIFRRPFPNASSLFLHTLSTKSA
ncbi:MAG: hypothetical protein D8H97_10175 [Neisseria sp.]|nr:MAG: hypothetical protein D8H97_10175 [Neisseria sp.]